jgi:PAS domain S-box-containing protein
MSGETAEIQRLPERDFLDKIPNGLGIFAYENGKYSTVYLNDGYYRMVHVRREDRGPEIRRDPSLAIFPEDRGRLNEKIEAALRENEPMNCNIRILQGDGGYRWYNLHAIAAERSGGRIVWYNSYTDIDAIVRAENETKEGRRRYELAVRSARLAVWEYDIGTQRLIVPEGESGAFAMERYGLRGPVLENVPASMLRMGLTDEDRENFLRLYEEVRAGKEFATADVWFRRTPEEEPECDRLSYITVKDETGRPVRAYGSGLDVTAQMRERLGFHRAIQSILTANPEALCVFRLNLTQNRCSEGNGISSFIVNTLRSDTVDGLFEQCRALIPDDGDRRAFYSVFDRNKLLAEYRSGRQSLHADYRRRDETGRRFWVRTYLSLLSNPETGDVEGVLYSLDISREVQQNEIFRVITGREYDLIALLNLDSGAVEAVRLGEDLIPEYRRSFPAPGARCDFTALRRNGAADWVAPEDREKYWNGTDPARIRAELDRNGVYELIVRGLSKERGSVYRKLQHYYLNAQKDSVLIIDSDVTQSCLGQQREVERAKNEARRTQDILDYISSGVCVLRMPDPEHLLIEYSNKQMPLLLGFANGAQSPEQISGSADKDAAYFADAFSGVHPDDLPAVREAYRKGFSQQRFGIPRFRLAAADGSYIWAAVDLALRERRADGNVFYGTYRDISKEVELEEELEKQRKAHMERTMVDTIAGLPSSSALFRILDGRTIIPESYSDEFCRMGGWTQQDELFRDNAYGGVHPDDRTRVASFIAKHLDDTEPFHMVYRIITKIGSYIWVSVAFNKFRLGETCWLYAVYTDISDLKKQEERLREQYDAAQSSLDSVAGSYIAARRMNLTRNRLESAAGKNPLAGTEGMTVYDEYVAAVLSAVPGQKDRERCAAFYARGAMLAAYQNGERLRSLEYPYCTPDGNMIWVRNTVNLTKRPGSGDVIAFSAVSDINSERLVGSVMNRLATTHYDNICCFDASNGKIVFFFSPDGTLDGLPVRTGDSYEKLLRAYDVRFAGCADRDDCAVFMSIANVLRLLDAGERCAMTYNVLGGNGEKRAKLAEFFYVDPEYHLVGVVRTDYTAMQRRQLEQEERLRAALDAAERANAAKSDFLSRMSHDIRTPLNGIIGMTYLTEELELPEKARENLKKIDTSSKFLLSLINDILDLTKAESDRVELRPEPYPPQEFESYIDSVFRPLCEEKHQTLDANTSRPMAIPLFDKLRVNQVLFNLLSNAVKYTQEGGTITFRSRFGAPDKKGRMSVEFEIGDNGCGMSGEFQKHLFEPFTQERRQDASDARGSGLGLAIVKRLIDLMGGTIRVESRPEEGTRFTVKLTADSVPAGPDGGAAAQNKAGANAGCLAGKRVLLCEDHPLNQEIAAALLRERGMDADIAGDGRTGAERFRASPPGYYDAVLMDIRMPVLDGYGAAAAIRAMDRADAKRVPIIAMTADAFSDDVQKCLDAGMNGHIAKPIDPGALYETLRKEIEERERTGRQTE